jgi:hypothetical protein
MTIDKKHIEEVCRRGQGAQCCKYLVAGAGGFECGKLDATLRQTIDWASKTYTARADNCPGYGVTEEKKKKFDYIEELEDGSVSVPGVQSTKEWQEECLKTAILLEGGEIPKLFELLDPPHVALCLVSRLSAVTMKRLNPEETPPAFNAQEYNYRVVGVFQPMPKCANYSESCLVDGGEANIGFLGLPADFKEAVEAQRPSIPHSYGRQEFFCCIELSLMYLCEHLTGKLPLSREVVKFPDSDFGVPN